MRLKALKVYGIVILVVMAWWMIAFKQQATQASRHDRSLHQTPENHHSELNTAIRTIQRKDLLQALSGNTALMARLIADWDTDAQILQAEGLQPIERLPQADFVRSQILGRQLKNASPKELARLETASRQKHLLDDAGKRLDLTEPLHRFLPQTYVAASFLLALAPTNEIVALPRHLREQAHLYPRTLTNQIALDIDRYNSEKLFQAKPQIAFVARYSHPATLQALANQGIFLYMMKNPISLEDIQNELVNVGHIINRPLEAELLKIFMDASMLALDNRLLLLTQEHIAKEGKPHRLLYLNYHQNFSVPTPKTSTGQLLKRLAQWDISLPYAQENGNGNGWSAPIDKERIVNLNPDCLIISTENPQQLQMKIQSDETLSQVAALRNHRLCFVDESVQQSPSQFMVLAYYDLIQSLTLLP